MARPVTNAAKVVLFGGAYYLLAGAGVFATFYLASHLFLLVGREVEWLLRLVGL